MNRNVIIVVVLIVAGLGYMQFQAAQEAAAEANRLRAEEAEKIAERARQAKQGKVQVLRANVNLRANTRVPETAIRVDTIDKKFAPPNSRLRLSDVVNRYTTETIYKDEISNKARLTDQARKLTTFLQEGERFYSMRIEGISAVSGFIKQGDRVDIMAIMEYNRQQICRTVLSNLEIFSVNKYMWEVSAEEKQKGNLGTLTITFKLSGRQASRLIQLVQLGANLRFSLRPPTDLDQTITPGWTLAQIIEGATEPDAYRIVEIQLQGDEDQPPPMQTITVIKYNQVSEAAFPLTTATTAPIQAADEFVLPPQAP